MIKPINLDALNLDDLEEAEARYLRLTDEFRNLAEYARRKGEAIRARKRGEIDRALKLETYLEALYNLLSKEVRW